MEQITADEAARLIEDGDAILISGSGGGHSVPEALLAAVERRFLDEAKPRGLTSVSVVGVGDRAALGASHLAHEGLLKRAITSALVDSPGLVRMAAEDKIEAYTLPQGVLSQLMRDMAAGRPGLLTKTGLDTFVDPRQQGARQSPRTPPAFVEVVNLAGEECSDRQHHAPRRSRRYPRSDRAKAASRSERQHPSATRSSGRRDGLEPRARGSPRETGTPPTASGS